MVWSLPFALWMLQGYVADIPRELEEAAVGGRGEPACRSCAGSCCPLLAPGRGRDRAVHVHLGLERVLLRPGAAQDPDQATLPVTLARFVGSEGQVQLGPLAGGVTAGHLPSLVFFAFMQRRLTSGLAQPARSRADHNRRPPIDHPRATQPESPHARGQPSKLPARWRPPSAWAPSPAWHRRRPDDARRPGQAAVPEPAQDSTVAATKKIVADWNAENPNIQVEYVQGDWNSVHDQLVTPFEGGDARRHRPRRVGRHRRVHQAGLPGRPVRPT